ncbi:MAG: hypothetical protein PHF63_00095 [Herbinix sp.]|nr:hypothetical protein [Herbinix sp.]
MEYGKFRLNTISSNFIKMVDSELMVEGLFDIPISGKTIEIEPLLKKTVNGEDKYLFHDTNFYINKAIDKAMTIMDSHNIKLYTLYLSEDTILIPQKANKVLKDFFIFPINYDIMYSIGGTSLKMADVTDYVYLENIDISSEALYLPLEGRYIISYREENK